MGGELTELLTNEQLDEFAELKEDSPEAKRWLKETVPDYEQRVQGEHEKLAVEIQAAKDKRKFIEELES